MRLAGNDEALPYDLLLEADPSRAAIDAYLHAPGAKLFVLPHDPSESPASVDSIQAVLALLPISDACLEIKNIAVAEEARGLGLGRMLLDFARQYARKNEYKVLRIGTGNSSLDQLRIYQKAGFRMKSILPDFFVKNYPEPLFENGLQCRDMVVLEQDLT